jgi:CubicO group peptidase (beta-lactamase class C family)
LLTVISALYDGKLDFKTQIDTFRHIDRVFPSRIIRPGGTPYPLAKFAKPLQHVPILEQYLDKNRVAGLLVLKDGKVALERYQFGNNQQSRWVSWSIAKSITSTLVGAALQDRSISSLEDPVTKYLPQMRGSAYDGATIRHVLTMSSGVRWNEAYMDPKSDRRKMLEIQQKQRPGTILDFMRTLPRAAQPGTRWNYSTGETHVLGAILRAAIKRPLSDYLGDKIWRKFAMEADATWWLDSPDGLEVGGSGFSATLRDYGRFGQFVLGGGKAGGQQVTPAGWFPDAGMPKIAGYGYMWWSAGEAYQGVGIFGQYLYIHPRERVVIAVQSARQTPTGSTVISDQRFFDEVVGALR